MNRLRSGLDPRLLACLLCVVALLLGACDDDNSPSTPTEETTDIPTVTIEVTGGFGMLGASRHDFTAMGDGYARLTLTELMPVDTLTVGIGIGTPSATGSVDVNEVEDCAVFASDSSVRVNDSLLSQGLVADTVYCVVIFDVGNLFPGNEVTYKMSVEHS